MKTLTAAGVLKEFRAHYKPPRTFLDHNTSFQLLVATILSAQCTDARVNTVTPALFKKYPDPKRLAAAGQLEIEEMIHSCGTFRNKAMFIRTLAQVLLDKHGGEVPKTMEELIELPGVGRKTASIILYASFGKNLGIAVDTHVTRISLRLGLTKHRDPKKIELDLMKALPPEDWGEINTQMISHGRAICTAYNRKCDQCMFQDRCPSSWTRGRPDLAANPRKRR
jgi:endonuclease III